MAKPTYRTGGDVTPRSNANIHGKASGSAGANNPVVHSKATRRYGVNDTTGVQPTKPRAPDLYSAGSVARVGAVGKPISESVGYATDGSGRIKHATHPNTHVSTDGLHGSASTAHLKHGMRSK